MTQLSIISLTLLFACQSNSPEFPEDPTIIDEVAVVIEKTVEIPKVAPTDILLTIDDVAILKDLESTHGLVQLIPTNTPFEETQRVQSKEMMAGHSGYRQIAKHLQGRIDAVSNEIERDLIIELKDALKYPAGNVGRRLDNRWFESEIAFFQMTGVVNRIDKKDFYGGCGEVRFIYRLAYQNEEGASSRLPVTLNVVMENQGNDCSEVARRWMKPESERTVDWLRESPLNLEHLRFKQMEVNAQIVRFPSGLETEFAGQALYLFRVYGMDPEGALTEVPLENTPDVLGLRQDTEKYNQLLEWTNAHVADIDNGTYLIPDQFLATEAISYSTLGIHRSANKPFDALWDDKDIVQINMSDVDTKWLRSPSALVDRLNNGSCVGCHQASTTAGFHFLGQDDPDISGVTNRLALPFSSHFHNELPRRAAQLAQLINGEVEERFRPHSLAPVQTPVQTNHNCILPEYQTDFVGGDVWTCAETETCVGVVQSNVVENFFGQCIPSQEDLLSGQTCRVGSITANNKSSDTVFNLHAYAETFDQSQLYELPEDRTFAFDSYNCRPTRIGVPLGRTYRKCIPEERAFEPQQSNVYSPEICAVVGGAKFDSCVEKDFHKCLDSIVARGMVDSCHNGRFCREDYICQSLPYQLNGVDTDRGKIIADAGVGFCTPTYFVFQLRLDGHPVP